jgi:hypothetical protein
MTTREGAKFRMSASNGAPGSSDFPKRPIPSRPRDSSLCCKPRLKAVVWQFRNRYRKFESTSLRHRVRDFRQSPEKYANCPCVAAICIGHRHRRTPK